jgi:hypothetical protein
MNHRGGRKGFLVDVSVVMTTPIAAHYISGSPSLSLFQRSSNRAAGHDMDLEATFNG